MKTASALWNDRGYWLSAHSRTVDGINFGKEPVINLVRDANPADLGRAVKQVLECFEDGIPDPKNWNLVPNVVLAAASVRRANDFYRRSRSVGVIELNEGIIRFSPSRLMRRGPNFTASSQSPVDVSWEASDEDIGQALILAFERCEKE